jgi:hypothetical protein
MALPHEKPKHTGLVFQHELTFQDTTIVAQFKANEASLPRVLNLDGIVLFH